MFTKLFRFIWMHIVLVVCLIVYLLLAGKNPFSERNLIANLDPYPDTFYYSLPAWNFVHGKGFIVSDGIVSAVMTVPPVYPIYLIPFFAIFNDVRAFYFGNMLLAFGTIFFFYLILRKIYGKTILLFLPMFLLVTNHYFYQVPSLLMAENPSIFLVVLLLYLFTFQNKKLICLGIFFTLLLSLIKLSNVPLTVVFGLFFVYRLYSITKPNKKSLFTGALVVIIIICLLVLPIITNTIKLISFGAFSGNFVLVNLKFYFLVLLGNSANYLWWSNKLWLPVVGCLSLGGLVCSFKLTNRTELARLSATVVVSLVLFMSFFYFPDTRYIQVLTPTLLIFVLTPFILFKNILLKYFVVLIILVIYIFSSNNLGAWRLQAAINLKYREDPWQYFAVKHLNNYFAKFETKPEVFTFLPRYLVYYFGNQKYVYNRISPDQRFEINIDPIKNIHLALESGREVFVTNAYILNDFNDSEHWWKIVEKKFTIRKVDDGCFGSCDIYELSLK